MSDINNEIEELAEHMEKSTQDPKEVLLQTIDALGPEGLRKKMSELGDSEKLLLKSVLEEMNLFKGGPGSGRRGHKTAKKDNPMDKMSYDQLMDKYDELNYRAETEAQSIEEVDKFLEEADKYYVAARKKIKKGFRLKQEYEDFGKGGPGSGRRKGKKKKEDEEFEARTGRKPGEYSKDWTPADEGAAAARMDAAKKPGEYSKDWTPADEGAAAARMDVAKEKGMQKAVEMDDAYQAKYVQGKITDTKLQEDKADDDQDEKLVKPEAAKHPHQGGSKADGESPWEGQVIKGKDPIDVAGDAKATADEEECPMDKKDAKLKKKCGASMKKSREELDELRKSVEEELKAEGVEPTVELIKGKMKEKLLAEEEQSKDNLDDLQKEKTRGDRSRPETLKVEKENKDAQDKVDAKPKMKKAVWAGENDLLKANTGGRNFHFSVNDYYDEALEKANPKEEAPAEETLEKSDAKEETPKEFDINDCLEKSQDRSWDEVVTDAQLLLNKAKQGNFSKSFQDNEIAEALGLTEEQAKEILGE